MFRKQSGDGHSEGGGSGGGASGENPSRRSLSPLDGQLLTVTGGTSSGTRTSPSNRLPLSQQLLGPSPNPRHDVGKWASSSLPVADRRRNHEHF